MKWMDNEVTTTTPDPPPGMKLIRAHTRVEPVYVSDDFDHVPAAWVTVERAYVWAPAEQAEG